MRQSSVVLVVAVLILIIITTNIAGCVAQTQTSKVQTPATVGTESITAGKSSTTTVSSTQPTVNTYHGKTFSVNYPLDWQTFDAFTLTNLPESYRSTIPEAVAFAPSLKYPTPLVVSAYAYPKADPFGKQEAEAKLSNITLGKGTKFSYLDTITVGGEPAYEYRSYDAYGNAARNVLLRKGSYLYYIQGYEDEKNLKLLIQSFQANP